VGGAPLTSIALLTYNRCASLPRALASARAQDYPNLEILILDNASTDGTEALCRAAAAADPRIRYWRHPHNLGAIGNFDSAPALARGDYFMWLADDDWISRNYVSTCVELLEADPSVALAAGRAEFPDEAPAKRRPAPIEERADRADARLLHYLWDPRDNSVFYGVYRRALVAPVGMKRMLAGDWLTVAAVATQGKLVVTDAATVVRASGGTSRSHRHAARALGLPWWHGREPKIATAIGIARYFWRDYPFADLARHERRRRALRVLLVLAARKRVLRWLLWFVPADLRPAGRRA